MQRLLVTFGMLAMASTADAAPAFLDGPWTETSGACSDTGDGSSRTMLRSKTGYVIDPIAEIPKLGQPVDMHAYAINTGCTEADRETVSFELLELPPGARLATPAELPQGVDVVRCFSSGSGETVLCPSSPQPLTSGGWLLGARRGMVPGSEFEVQVAVVFDRVLSGEHIRIKTTSGTNPQGVESLAWVTSPFQPWLPANKRGDDLALLGASFSSSPAEAGTLPVAFSNDDGSFTVNNYPVGDFQAWARTPNVKRLSGDFNGDGYTDYALVGGAGWNTIPVAMSKANGRFDVTNYYVGEYGAWAATANVKAVVGDFNGDNRSDIALVGGAGWRTVPVAYSATGGFFTIANVAAWDFGGLASQGGQPIVGDFNRDNRSDIALVGGSAPDTMPLIYGMGFGWFDFVNPSANQLVSVPSYPFGINMYWVNYAAAAREPGVQVVTGDYNRDGHTDIALVGTAGSTIKVLMGNNQRTWWLKDAQAGNFATWARSPNVKVLAGDFDKDGDTDLALTGVAGWATIPVASVFGSGAAIDFTVTNNSAVMGGVGNFAEWASWPGVRAVAGDFNGDGYGDIALTGGMWWTSIPVALGVGNGTFAIINRVTNRFPQWASDTGATVIKSRAN